MPDQSEAPIVRNSIAQRLRGEALISGPSNRRLMREAAEIIRLCEEALEKLTAHWQAFQDSDSGNQADAYYTLVKPAYEDWKFASAVHAKIKGQNP